MTARTWSVDEVRALGVRTDLVTAGSVLGLSRNVAYDMAARGMFPVPALRLGAKWIVPVAPLLELLGLAPDSSEAEPASPAVATATAPSGGSRHDDCTVPVRRTAGGR